MSDRKPTYEQLLAFVQKVSDVDVMQLGLEADAVLEGASAEKIPSRLLVVVERGKVQYVVADEEHRIVVADLDAHGDTRIPLGEPFGKNEGEFVETNYVSVIAAPQALNRMETENFDRSIFSAPEEPEEDESPGLTP
jgi:hypothetical protein